MKNQKETQASAKKRNTINCLICFTLFMLLTATAMAKTHYINTTSSSDDINIGNAKEIFIDTSSGGVGFGTTSLSAAAHIEVASGSGSLLLRAASMRNAPDMIFHDSSGNQMGRIWANYTSVDNLLLASDSTADAVTIADGKVGIGIPVGSVPYSPLTIESTSTQLRLSYDAANSATLSTNSGGYLTLDSSGNIIELGSSNTDVIIDDGGLAISTSGVNPSTPADGNVEIEDGSMCVGDLGCTASSTGGSLYVETRSVFSRQFYAANIGTISSTIGYNQLHIYGTTDEMVAFTSSRRYKENITPLDIDTEKTLELRPVEFVFKDTGEWNFGLVAEETDKHIPDLVLYNDSGAPDGVRYSMVPLFLIDLLKEQRETLKSNKEILQSQASLLQEQERRIAELESEISGILEEDHG